MATKVEKAENVSVTAALKVLALDQQLKGLGYHRLHMRLVREVMPVLLDITEELHDVASINEEAAR